MREITYREILENVDCGLLFFFEDDFVYPDSVEIKEILCNAIRMDDHLQEEMLQRLASVNKEFSTALESFLKLCKPAVDFVEDWTQIIDADDVVTQYQAKCPDLATSISDSYEAICSENYDGCLPILFQFGVYCNFSPQLESLHTEYISVSSRWRPFIVFDNYNSDIATEVELLVDHMPDHNSTVVCIIDNVIRDKERANTIIDELERICKKSTSRVIGAVVTSNEKIERINDTVFIEYVSKTDVAKLKQALLHSSYHYLLRMIKDKLSYEIEETIKKASSHRNLAIHLVTMARIEGISNYEILMQWIDAICEMGVGDSDDVPKLVAISNMLDACEESPDFEEIEELADLNTQEAFDYNINRFYQPVSPGDIFQTSTGEIYILVGQSCDMMMTDKRKRRNGLCELVKAEATQLLWNNKTLDNFNHAWINNFRLGRTVAALKIDYKSRSFLDNEVISLSSFNAAGDCQINLTDDLSVDCLRMMQPYQLDYWKELQDYFNAVNKICASDVRQAFDVLTSSEHMSRIVALPDYVRDGNLLSYGIKRIARLKSHYYLYVYKLYLEHRGRIPFETINLARMQVVNAKFYNGKQEIYLDVNVFLARNNKSAQQLPWLISHQQIMQILETSFSGENVKNPQDVYQLLSEKLSIKLSSGKMLLLEKKSSNRVYYQMQ